MYKETSLIITKLNIPTVSLKLIKRPKLFKKLNDYLKYKLILINAPAGYGKTALITSWLSQKQKRKAIITWLSLDEQDNDPELFWSYFLLSFYNHSSIFFTREYFRPKIIDCQILLAKLCCMIT